MKPRATVLLRDTVNWGQGISGLTGYEICIVLTRGYVALISQEDVQELSGYSWNAHVSFQQVRAIRHAPLDGRKRQMVYMHRWLMKPTAGQQVDHRDQHKFFGFKLVDNRRQNLRNVTQSQNQHNRRPQVGCTSRYKGVSWHTRDEKWAAGIRVNRRLIHLGYFTSETEAAKQYNQAHQHHFPGIHEGMNHITTTSQLHDTH